MVRGVSFEKNGPSRLDLDDPEPMQCYLIASSFNRHNNNNGDHFKQTKHDGSESNSVKGTEDYAIMLENQGPEGNL